MKVSSTDIVSIIEPIIEDHDMELVDMEFRRERGGWVLRLFIDRLEGMTLGDCAEISGRVGAVLDVKDIIDVPYALEVSSPGVNRPLRKEKDFQRFVGNTVVLKTMESRDGQKNFKGQIMDVREGNLLLLCLDGREVIIPLQAIARAHLDYQWDEAASEGRRLPSKGSRR